MTEWIKCSDRLPMDQQRIIFCGPTVKPTAGDFNILNLTDGRVIYSFEDYYSACYENLHELRHGLSSVTHWLPLPRPPRELMEEYKEVLGWLANNELEEDDEHEVVIEPLRFRDPIGEMYKNNPEEFRE